MNINPKVVASRGTVFLACWLLFAVACQDDSLRTDILAIHSRLIESPPQDLFDPQSFRRLIPVFEWQLSEPNSVSDFKIAHGEGGWEITNEGLTANSARPFIRLHRSIELDAQRVHKIEVDIGRASQEPHDIAPEFHDLETLRRHTQEGLRQQSTNLRLEVETSKESRSTLRGALRDEMVGPRSVTLPGLSCQCVTWSPPHGLAFDVLSGNKLTIFFEQAADQPIELRAEVPTPAEEAASVRRLLP